MNNIQASCGSVIGRYHLGDDNQIKGNRNQDEVKLYQTEDFIIGLVCDGMGDGTFSEFGAAFGARYISKFIANTLKENPDEDLSSDSSFWGLLSANLLYELEHLAHTLYVSDEIDNPRTWNDFIYNHFFFTIVGFVVTEKMTTIFSCGDGYYAYNGEVHEMGPYPSNSPPFLMTSLMRKTSQGYYPKYYFTVQHHKSTNDLQTLMVSTDGLRYWERNQNKPMPGSSTEKVGPVSRLWEDDINFSSDVSLNMLLRKVQRKVILVNYSEQTRTTEGGYLQDDLAAIVVRRQNVPLQLVEVDETLDTADMPLVEVAA